MKQKNYDDNFHKSHLKNSINSAKEIVPLFLKYYEPKSVLDIGCGLGTWLSVFKSYDCEIFGVDGDFINTDNLVIDRENFISQDLNISLDLKRKFDLTLSLEVAEHILPSNAETFIYSLCRHSDIILFSAAIKGQGGTFHCNEQDNQYWVDIFNTNSFECIDFLRHELWENKKVSWWYRQNILVFINSARITDEKYSKISERRQRNLSTYVHPELLELKIKKIEHLELVLSNPFRVLKYYLGRLKSKLR